MRNEEHGLFDFASKLGFFGGLYIRNYRDRLYFFEPYHFYKRIKPEFNKPGYPLDKILTHSAVLIIDAGGYVIKSRHNPPQGRKCKLTSLWFNSDIIYKITGKTIVRREHVDI